MDPGFAPGKRGGEARNLCDSQDADWIKSEKRAGSIANDDTRASLRAKRENLRSKKMAAAGCLGAQIALVMAICREDVGHTFGDAYTVALERSHLLGVI